MRFFSHFSFSQKTFLFSLIFCLIALSALAIAGLEFYARIYVIPFKHTEEDWPQKTLFEINQKKNSAKIILVGDSHAQISPKTYDTLSLVRGGDSITAWYVKFKYALPKLTKAKYLFIEADYHMFSSFFSEKNYDYYYMFTDEDFPKGTGIFMKNPNPNQEEKEPFIFHSFNQNIGPNLIPHMVHHLRFKYSKTYRDAYLHDDPSRVEWPSKGTEQSRQNAASASANYYFKRNQGIVPEFIFYYKKIIEMAQARGMTVIMVRYPLVNEYWHAFDTELKEDVAKVDALYKEIQNEYGLELWDLSHAFDDHQEYFFNEDHLNKKGIAALTDIGNARFKRLLRN